MFCAAVMLALKLVLQSLSCCRTTALHPQHLRRYSLRIQTTTSNYLLIDTTAQISSGATGIPMSIYFYMPAAWFLANVFAICRRPSVCCLSVCNVRAPYSGDWDFRRCFYAIWYLCHPWPFGENFVRSSQGKPSVGGVKVKHKRGSRI